MTPKPVPALDTLVGNAILNATALEVFTTAMKVTVFVNKQPLKPTLWSARQAPDSGQVVDEP